LWQLVQLKPGHALMDFVCEFANLSVPVKRNFIQQIFVNWHWSWKWPTIKHVQKYRPDNIAYYAEWVNLIPLFPEQAKIL